MTLPFSRHHTIVTLLLIVIIAVFTTFGTAHAFGGHVAEQAPVRDARQAVVTQGDFSYENATLTEDITWSGVVVIRGYLLIAPQATVRIEPGTTVRFMKSAILHQTPRMVVMGRLQCSGTVEQPVLFTSNFAEVRRGDWRGIMLLSSEKRNQCENCLFEGAEIAIEARYSTFTAKGVTISRALTGMFLQDSTASLSSVSIKGCETGLEARDSELDLRDGTLEGNRRGIVAHRSGLVMASIEVTGSEQQGVVAEECGIKFNSCGFSSNGSGALLKGGVGQIFLSRFVRNRDVGLHMSGARVRVQRSLFADNPGDGLRLDDGRGLVWSSAFDHNGGYNLANNGSEEVSAVQNWWGNNDEAAIMAKLHVTAKGAINVSPWLAEKPLGIP